MMKYTILLLFIAILAVGCQEETTSEETEVNHSTEITEPDPTTDPETDFEQTNVVTPEFWESYETDILIVFFYSKKESSGDNIHKVKEEILNGEEELGYQFHEYHTDENMGMVQVDDNVFFNLTEYLWSSDEGFVLLKKGGLMHIPGSEVTQSVFTDSVKPFFQ